MCSRQNLDEAMDTWYGKAREESESLTGVADQARAPKFVWEPMLGAAKDSRKDGATPAVIWRTTARRIDALADMIKHHTRSAALDRSGHDVAISAVVSKIERSVEQLPAALKSELAPQLKRMAASAKTASAYGDERWVRSLAAAARTKAKKLEDAAATDRFAKWKEALARGPNSALGRTPTRKAYRWVKGLTGWQPSSIGKEHENDEVPDIDEDREPQGAQRHGGANLAKPWMAWDGDKCKCGPLNDQAQVNKEGREWASIWDTQADYNVSFPADTLKDLPPISVQALRNAAMAFPVGTGVGRTTLPRGLLQDSPMTHWMPSSQSCTSPKRWASGRGCWTWYSSSSFPKRTGGDGLSACSPRRSASG